MSKSTVIVYAQADVDFVLNKKIMSFEFFQKKILSLKKLSSAAKNVDQTIKTRILT